MQLMKVTCYALLTNFCNCCFASVFKQQQKDLSELDFHIGMIRPGQVFWCLDHLALIILAFCPTLNIMLSNVNYRLDLN